MRSRRADEVYSEDTSRRQVPALFKEISHAHGWRRGTTNVDIGGGAWDDGTRWLARKGVRNVVYDPGHVSDQETAEALLLVIDGRADTATLANVLNVIPTQASRNEVIELAANCIGPDGVAFFSVHEGDCTGRGRETRDGWQENRFLDEYEDEVRRYFDEVEVIGRRIEARSPVEVEPRVLRRYL